MPLLDQGQAVSFVYTTDVERSVAWYRDVLGATVRERDDYGASLAGAGALLRITMLPAVTPSEHPVAGWEVASVAAWADALEKHGVRFTVYDGMGQDERGIWTGPDGSRLAWFADPDGNMLMISEAAAAGA
ncbi:MULTISPECIES: VOC family protein [Sphingomonas]|uniref:VOC family protein n=1 Tax=Sphingomonas TaxID=13687 RepID=UPI000DEFC09F|nr:MULTISPECIES: VOC family protein [Sphingomonas]